MLYLFSCDDDITTSNGNYFWVNNSINFWSAERYCSQQYYTSLASIHTLERNAEIISSCPSNSNCWVGLNDLIELNDYEWVDGTKYDYKPPINRQSNEHCIHIDMTSNGSWSGAQCNVNQYSFFCNAPNNTQTPTADTLPPTQIPTVQPTPSPTQPPQYPLNVFYSPNEKYILINTSVNWWKARFLCTQYFHTNLAIISAQDTQSDDTEAATLCSISDTDKCWIGLNRIFGEYEWIDDLNNKGTQQITPLNENNGYCAFIDNSTLWEMADCDTSNNFILCDHPPPTVEPTPMPSNAPTEPTQVK